MRGSSSIRNSSNWNAPLAASLSVNPPNPALAEDFAQDMIDLVFIDNYEQVNAVTFHAFSMDFVQ